MKIIMTGGGTGGHIYPAIAIIEEFQKVEPDAEILYIGTKNSLEEKLIPPLGIEFETIRVRGLPRKINLNTFKSVRDLFFGLKESKKIIKSFDPDVVFGTGGFVTGPVLYNASKTNALTAFHEQNSFPGLTNRILSNYVDMYFVTFEESIKHFKYENRSIITGNPIRNRFLNLNEKKVDYDYFNLDSEKTTIFSFGGSNGSKEINDAIQEIIQIGIPENLQIIHITGPKHYDSFIEKVEEKITDNFKVFPYMDQMDRAYNISDLVICSSGAITLAEISYLGIASILIPKAYTTENHQEYNAKSYVDSGASRMILEKDLEGKYLLDQIIKITEDNNTLKSMKYNALKLSNHDAAEIIVNTISESRW